MMTLLLAGLLMAQASERVCLGGGTISGEIRAVDGTPAGANTERIGEVAIQQDGSFEVLRVPPGTFNVQVWVNNRMTLQISLDVGTEDLNVDLPVTNSGPPPARGR